MTLQWSWRKIFAPLAILYPFIKSVVNPFDGIASNFFDISFNSFWTNACFVLFELFLLLKLNSLLSKSVLFTKLAISFLLAELGYFNLAVKWYAVNFLHSWVVIYLAWSWSFDLFSISVIFVLYWVFCFKLLVSVVINFFN